MITKCRVVAVITLVFLMPNNSAVSQTKRESQCLSYEPTVVTVKGVLVRKTFPGPPNYESATKGDKRETVWLLNLPKGVCVNEGKSEPDLNSTQRNVAEIQLVLQPQQYSDHKSLLGRRVIATGTLFGEHTGHHHTPVLLTVRTLKVAN